MINEETFIVILILISITFFSGCGDLNTEQITIPGEFHSSSITESRSVDDLNPMI